MGLVSNPKFMRITQSQPSFLTAKFATHKDWCWAIENWLSSSSY